MSSDAIAGLVGVLVGSVLGFGLELLREAWKESGRARRVAATLLEVTPAIRVALESRVAGAFFPEPLPVTVMEALVPQAIDGLEAPDAARVADLCGHLRRSEDSNELNALQDGTVMQRHRLALVVLDELEASLASVVGLSWDPSKPRRGLIGLPRQ